MLPLSEHDRESLSLDAAERIEAVCTRFEEAWKKPEPALERYLEGVTDHERGPLSAGRPSGPEQANL